MVFSFRCSFGCGVGKGKGREVVTELINGVRLYTVFTDANNVEIFALKKKHFTLHKTFHAEDPKGHELFVITKKFSGGSKGCLICFGSTIIHLLHRCAYHIGIFTKCMFHHLFPNYLIEPP